MANDYPAGFAQPTDSAGEFNRTRFQILQALLKVQTSMPVRVVSCTNSGGLSPVGTVNVVPMVHQVDSSGNAIPHTTIFNIPYSRAQGGTNAIIIDPQPGDIGVCVFASRDISKIKNTKAPGNPGSHRNHSFSDGMYIGPLLNAVPTQFIQFNADAITITSPTAIHLNAPIVNITASTSFGITSPHSSCQGQFDLIDGNLTDNGTVLHTHVHTSSTAGTPTSEPI